MEEINEHLQKNKDETASCQLLSVSVKDGGV